MTTCRLTLIGSLSENQNSCDTPNLPKHIIIHDEPDEIVTIGRENSKTKVNYVLGDSSKPRVVSRLHATLKYNADDLSFWLSDQSVNGTYVNYVRVPINGLKLEMEDIVCFFHRNGANIKPGEKVEPFDTHLKYRVEFVDEDDENLDEDEAQSKSSKEPLKTPRKRGSFTLDRSCSPETIAKKPRTKNSSSGKIRIGNKAPKRSTKSSKVELVQDEEELCAADLCMRPIGLAIDWIQCDMCSNWYHQMCLGITTAKAIDPSKPYYCPNCRSK